MDPQASAVCAWPRHTLDGVARWTGEWLSALGTPGATGAEAPRWPGEHLKLPEDGVGAVAGGGRRFAALLVDLLFASLLTSLFIRPDYADLAAMQEFNLWAGLTWAVLTVVPVAFFGFTPGMAILGIRVARLDGGGLVGLWRALIRCVLTAVIIPAAVRNADSRGWHDRATGTVVVRMR